MKSDIVLKPSYWANVSGGKDSLFMLKYILSHPERYPLDGVVHYELEIDYPFIKDVVDYMESECKKFGIRFVRFKPRTSWEEFYKKYGFPTRNARWCNNVYKLDCAKQIDEWLKENNLYCVHYIGYCANEVKRINNRKNVKEIYPLAENGIEESYILEWAKKQSIFNNFYITNKRCGCMFCPISARMNYAYLYKYYPQKFWYMISKMRETENKMTQKLCRKFSIISSNPKYDSNYLIENIENKWLIKLNEIERVAKSNLADKE